MRYLEQLVLYIHPSQISTTSNPRELFPKLRSALLSGFFLQVACFKELGTGENPRAKLGFYIPAEAKVTEDDRRVMDWLSLVDYNQHHFIGENRPFYRIHASSVLGRSFTGYNLGPVN